MANVGQFINQYLNGHASDIIGSNGSISSYAPDITGYTFIIMLSPDLSGVPNDTQLAINDICKNIVFFGLDFTPPAITINSEAINTQASVSMPYATTKIATGEISITFLDDTKQSINSLHNIWIEYIYNQLWGDIEPANKYLDPTNHEYYGALDYATSLYVLKYDSTVDSFLTSLPSMVGKATGIFPLGLPVKETLGARSSNELSMQTVNYTCSYFEVVHPKSDVQVYSTITHSMLTKDQKSNIPNNSSGNVNIWDEVKSIMSKYSSLTGTIF